MVDPQGFVLMENPWWLKTPPYVTWISWLSRWWLWDYHAIWRCLKSWGIPKSPWVSTLKWSMEIDDSGEFGDKCMEIENKKSPPKSGIYRTIYRMDHPISVSMDRSCSHISHSLHMYPSVDDPLGHWKNTNKACPKSVFFFSIFSNRYFTSFHFTLPSGKHTKSYWTWPFIVDLPIKDGDLP